MQGHVNVMTKSSARGNNRVRAVVPAPHIAISKPPREKGIQERARQCRLPGAVIAGVANFTKVLLHAPFAISSAGPTHIPGIVTLIII